MFSRFFRKQQILSFMNVNNYFRKNAFHSVSGDIITITESAWAKIGSILNTYNKNSNIKRASMLLSINGGGCNGFKYNLNLDTKEYKKYSFVENEENRVYIDPIGEMYLLGTKIDYVKEDFSKNIFESKFVFIPDSSIATNCGCGTSFSPR